MQRYIVAVGYQDGIKPGNLVGAIANEADLDSRYIGHIEIFDQCAIVDLPDGMPTAVMSKLKKSRVVGKPLAIRQIGEDDLTTIANSSDRPRGNGNRDNRGGAKRGGPRNQQKQGFKKNHRKGNKPSDS